MEYSQQMPWGDTQYVDIDKEFDAKLKLEVVRIQSSIGRVRLQEALVIGVSEHQPHMEGHMPRVIDLLQAWYAKHPNASGIIEGGPRNHGLLESLEASVRNGAEPGAASYIHYHAATATNPLSSRRGGSMESYHPKEVYAERTPFSRLDWESYLLARLIPQFLRNLQDLGTLEAYTQGRLWDRYMDFSYAYSDVMHNAARMVGPDAEQYFTTNSSGRYQLNLNAPHTQEFFFDQTTAVNLPPADQQTAMQELTAKVTELRYAGTMRTFERQWASGSSPQIVTHMVHALKLTPRIVQLALTKTPRPYILSEYPTTDLRATRPDSAQHLAA